MKYNQDSKSSAPISSYFGELCFDFGKMRVRLAKTDLDNLQRALDLGKKISPETANAIAAAAKDWAVSLGATHFCHWFQPLTGQTAEKHDAMISIQSSNQLDMRILESFTGGQLLQGEPDASSLPSGGMRSTFEARGYTAWDCTSPLFIIEDAGSKTLCIPTVYFGYHGQALDHKTPLLRSMQTLKSEGCKFLKLLGDVDIKNVFPTLGIEQEYFLVDSELASKRPDILLTGRTLLGSPPAKGQSLNDHYFGSISSRALAYMSELETELYRLGIPVKTRHNEVAPSQFEMAPIFERASIAVDHNALAMEVMKRVAKNHGLVCLLHEKPFSDVNGSGKHCNWSLCNEKDHNLFDPGKTPHQNLRFLALVAVMLKAVKNHGDKLSASVCTKGNELRLGALEAPPPILSVFLGSNLETVFELISKGKEAEAIKSIELNLGIAHISHITQDHADRNRTSPFAFTGNKFEFRSVGSSANISLPMAILNAAFSDALMEASILLKDFMSKEKARDKATIMLIKHLFNENKDVLFSGNNYSSDWEKEAKKRGLSSTTTVVEAAKTFGSVATREFFERVNILSGDELSSQANIILDRYYKTTLIEIRTLVSLCHTHVIPALERQLIQSGTALNMIKDKKSSTIVGDRLAEVAKNIAKIIELVSKVEGQLETFSENQAITGKSVNALIEGPLKTSGELRIVCDRSEKLTAADLWLLPRTWRLLFSL